MLNVALVLWIAWTYVALEMILESEHRLVPQRLAWCLVQLLIPFLGWPLYCLFGTGYLAEMDARLWPHRHDHTGGMPAEI